MALTGIWEHFDDHPSHSSRVAQHAVPAVAATLPAPSPAPPQPAAASGLLNCTATLSTGTNPPSRAQPTPCTLTSTPPPVACRHPEFHRHSLVTLHPGNGAARQPPEAAFGRGCSRTGQPGGASVRLRHRGPLQRGRDRGQAAAAAPAACSTWATWGGTPAGSRPSRSPWPRSRTRSSPARVTGR